MEKLIKEWIDNSKTYQGIIAHRQTCDKQRRGKFCIMCTGGDVEDVIRRMQHEIETEMDMEGNNIQRTTVFLRLVSLRATITMPRCVASVSDQKIIDYIKELTQKDQSEELEVEGA